MKDPDDGLTAFMMLVFAIAIVVGTVHVVHVFKDIQAQIDALETSCVKKP